MVRYKDAVSGRAPAPAFVAQLPLIGAICLPAHCESRICTGMTRQCRVGLRRRSKPPNLRPAIWSPSRATGTSSPAWTCSYTTTRWGKLCTSNKADGRALENRPYMHVLMHSNTVRG